MSPYLRSSSAQLLAFPKENSGDDGLAKSHFGSRKNFFMHKWLALSERYGSPLSAYSLTTFNDIVLGTWGSNLMIIHLEKAHILLLVARHLFGQLSSQQGKLGSREVKTSFFLIWLRADLFASKAPILVKLSWLSRILQVFQNVTSLTTESGIWDTNPLVITKAPPADQTWQVPYT